MHYVGRPIGPAAMQDAFALCLAADPEGFVVGEEGGRLTGYVFAPLHLSRVASVALAGGGLARMAWRWLRGDYGVGLRPVGMVARNLLHLWRSAGEPALTCDTRVFSVAVHPDFRGRGIAKALVAESLRRLRARGARRVRLEVRPGNVPAVRLYERAGFETRGRTHDSQGEWLVMLAELC